MQETDPPTQQKFTAPKTYFNSFPPVLQGEIIGVCVASSGVGKNPCAAFVVSAGTPWGAGEDLPPKQVPLTITIIKGEVVE